MRKRVYPAVLEAVVNEVLSLDGVRDAVLARVKELHEKGGAVAAELKKPDKEEKRLVAKDRSANGTSTSVGRAERTMRSTSRGWSGWMRSSLGGAEELPFLRSPL
jgi:hypothetical protein